jgi:folate-binding protein YgfZ
MEADDNRAMTSTLHLDGSATLSHWGVIRARGADAASFLHSQLTSDFTAMGMSEVRLAGFCSAKGRLQASFIAWKAAHDEILLACSRSVLPATLKRLTMFVLRSQCKLTDASDELSLQGLVGAPVREALGDTGVWHRQDVDGATLIRLPDAAGLPRALRVTPAAATADAATLPLATWQWLEVHSGVPNIEADNVDAFVPQMLNFELLGGVDFRKGCYPGQEVVARSQYRGTIKRRMFLFDVSGPAAAGQELFHSGDPGQPAGRVVNAAARPDGAGSSLLAEVKLAALAEGSLHLGATDGPTLQQRALPYDVPADAAASA